MDHWLKAQEQVAQVASGLFMRVIVTLDILPVISGFPCTQKELCDAYLTTMGRIIEAPINKRTPGKVPPGLGMLFEIAGKIYLLSVGGAAPMPAKVWPCLNVARGRYDA